MKRDHDFFLLATSMHSGGQDLRQRLALILRRPRTRWAALALLLAMMCLAAACAFSGGEAPPLDPAPETETTPPAQPQSPPSAPEQSDKIVVELPTLAARLLLPASWQGRYLLEEEPSHERAVAGFRLLEKSNYEAYDRGGGVLVRVSAFPIAETPNYIINDVLRLQYPTHLALLGADDTYVYCYSFPSDVQCVPGGELETAYRELQDQIEAIMADFVTENGLTSPEQWTLSDYNAMSQEEKFLRQRFTLWTAAGNMFLLGWQYGDYPWGQDYSREMPAPTKMAATDSPGVTFYEVELGSYPNSEGSNYLQYYVVDESGATYISYLRSTDYYTNTWDGAQPTKSREDLLARYEGELTDISATRVYSEGDFCRYDQVYTFAPEGLYPAQVMNFYLLDGVITGLEMAMVLE